MHTEARPRYAWSRHGEGTADAYCPSMLTSTLPSMLPMSKSFGRRGGQSVRTVLTRYPYSPHDLTGSDHLANRAMTGRRKIKARHQRQGGEEGGAKERECWVNSKERVLDGLF